MNNLENYTKNKLNFLEENLSFEKHGNKIILKIEIPSNSILKPLIYHDQIQKELECKQGKIILYIGNKKRSVLTDESVVIHKKVPHSYYNPNNHPAILHITFDYSEEYYKSLILLHFLYEKKMLDKNGQAISFYHKMYIAKMQDEWKTSLPLWFQQLNSKIVLSTGKSLGKFKDIEKFDSSFR